MSGLPESWITTSFMDILDINGGTQPPKKDFIYEPKENYIRLLQIRDFGKKPVPTYIPDSHKLRKCKDTDILIGRYGASVGRICTGMSGAYNVALAKVDIPQKFSNKYIKYYLDSSAFQEPLSRISRSAQNGFNKKDLKEISLQIPPLNEQIHIANKLDSLLGKLQATQKRLDKIPTLLKRYRQSVLAAAVSGELTKEWREGNDLPKVNTKNIQEAWKSLYEDKKRKYLPVIIDGLDQTFTNLPQTWEATNVGAVFDVHVGSTPSRKNPNYWNGTIHWVSSSEVAFNLIENTKEKITDEGLKNTSTRIHPSGTVMLAMIGQGKTRGQPAILKIKACHNQNTAAIRVHNDFCSSEYLFYYLWSKYEETRKVGAGNNQKALNKKTVQGLPFPLPPIKEQKQIVKRVEALFKLADQAEQHYQAAKQRTDKLTQSILSKAFRGELVPQDPNDEPASELLARIQAQRKIEEKANKKQSRKRVIKSKPKKVKAMTLSNAPKEYLSNLLREMNNEASAKELWNKSEMLIDDFYCQLKVEMETNIIEDKESSDPSMRLLKLAIQG